jgi:hypothetical protein
MHILPDSVPKAAPTTPIHFDGATLDLAAILKSPGTIYLSAVYGEPAQLVCAAEEPRRDVVSAYIDEPTEPGPSPAAKAIAGHNGREFAATFIDDIDLAIGIVHATRVAYAMDEVLAEAFVRGMREAAQHRMQMGSDPLYPSQVAAFFEVLDRLTETAIDRCVEDRGSPHPAPVNDTTVAPIESAIAHGIAGLSEGGAA